jgi:hypothetical protein
VPKRRGYSVSINETAVGDQRMGCRRPTNGHSGAGSKSLPEVPVGCGGGTANNYLESYDNVSSWLASTCDKEKVGWFIPGECENGHRFAKELVCGKEWCSICGEDGSVAHNRRFVRWLPKVQQFELMGYFVFTLPESVRGKYRTKKALSRLGHQVQELLKSCGYSRGLRRWHFFGDKSSKWHPHLNCLTDGGFLPSEKLKAVKCDYAALLGVDLADVNYHYRRSPGRMVHTLKYVTRATFRDYEWDIDMALELRGFRNMVVWGRGQWADAPAWCPDDLNVKFRAEVEGLDVEAIEMLAAGVCPVCGGGLTWGGALPIGLLDMVDKVSLGAGYYRLADIPPPRGLSVFPNLAELPDADSRKHPNVIRRLIDRARRVCAEAEYQAVLWRDLLNWG